MTRLVYQQHIPRATQSMTRPDIGTTTIQVGKTPNSPMARFMRDIERSKIIYYKPFQASI